MRKPVIGIPADRRLLGSHWFHCVGEKYINAVVQAAEAVPVLVPALGERYLREWLASFDGILFTGSPSNVEPHRYLGPKSAPGTLHDPERDATTLPMINGAIEAGMPVFGICRGFQEINVALGGTLTQKLQDLPGNLDHREDANLPLEEQYGPSHEIELVEGGMLAQDRGQPDDEGEFAALAGRRAPRAAPRHRGQGRGRRDRGFPHRRRQDLRARRAVAPGMEGDGEPVFTRAVRGLRPGRARTREQAVPMSQIKQFLKDHGITEVEAIVPDMAGVARGKVMPADKYAEDEGMRLPESIFLQTVTGEYPDDDSSIHPSEIDIELTGDPKTARVVPWAAEPTAQVIHDCFYGDGRPVPMAPRYVLRRVLDLYTAKGWRPVVAPELEFFLVEPNTDPDYPLKPPVGRSGRPEIGRQAYSIAAVNEFDPLFDDIYAFCEAQDLDIDTLIHEAGAAQMEINLNHGDALDLADQAFLFKRTAREAAHRHKIYATFMAKPLAGEPGSAMHIHQSIVDAKTGENIFSDADEQALGAVRVLHRGPAEVPAAGDVAVRAERQQLPPHPARRLGADQRAVGLRQPHRRPSRAALGRAVAPHRESPRRRGREPVPRDRGVARLRLPRHDRGPEADRPDHGLGLRPAFCTAHDARRRACAAARAASRWSNCSASGSLRHTVPSRKTSTRRSRGSSARGNGNTCC